MNQGFRLTFLNNSAFNQEIIKQLSCVAIRILGPCTGTIIHYIQQIIV